MNTKLMQVVLAVMLAVPSVHAGVVISKVLYDPLGTESGGEAVELRNDGTIAVNISTWVLTTESSATDATIPAGTALVPGATYLIADAGWSTAKDNPLWRSADHEETITLANADSGMALKDAARNAIDAVGWGTAANIKQGLFEGTPAVLVAEGKALIRNQDLNNNIADFSEGEPAFFSGDVAVLVLNVTNATTSPNTTASPALPLGAALNEDDSAEPGVQLKPVAGGTRALHLEVFSNATSVSAAWFGKSVQLSRNGTSWLGELPLEYWNAPGAQNIVITAGGQNATLPVTVLELKAAKLQTASVSLRGSQGKTASGTLNVQNQGNVAVGVSWAFSELVSGTQAIAVTNVDVPAVTVIPKETRQVDVTVTVPANALPGEYRTMVVMQTA